MRTLIDRLDLTSKTIHPSSPTPSAASVESPTTTASSIPQATVTDGLAVRGEQAELSGPQIRDWLRTIGLQSQRGGVASP